MLDLRQLRYFVAVAEEEHVGRAADRLHISQSPLSRQIAQLEKNLGLTLFERSQQRLRLTSDGRVFLTEATALLRHADRLENLGRRLGRGEEGGLCVGYVGDAMHTGILPQALRALHDERPGIHVALYDLTAAQQFEGLRQRSLDIALVPEAPPRRTPTCAAPSSWKTLCSWPCRAATRLPGSLGSCPKTSTISRGSPSRTANSRPGVTTSWPPARRPGSRPTSGSEPPNP